MTRSWSGFGPLPMSCLGPRCPSSRSRWMRCRVRWSASSSKRTGVCGDRWWMKPFCPGVIRSFRSSIRRRTFLKSFRTCLNFPAFLKSFRGSWCPASILPGLPQFVSRFVQHLRQFVPAFLHLFHHPSRRRSSLRSSIYLFWGASLKPSLNLSRLERRSESKNANTNRFCGQQKASRIGSRRRGQFEDPGRQKQGAMEVAVYQQIEGKYCAVGNQST